ncbi:MULTISPECIES: hypothetical protein [Streptococcus]|uniref:Uncharacterized protein n=1 Tax=Streptococcus sobrinus W1703 TaxID=1227275 RepID=U2JGB1_9STRE|nr:MULTISPECIES: hypothetical protein [Streptococcus]ERJ79062.1 hypothetical protein HMPREF1557_00062 [Streptococcus sobrinus W1703]
MDTSKLQSWMQGDGFYLITFIAVLILIKCWKSSNWIGAFSTLGFYALIASLTGGGKQLLTVIGKILSLFGIDTGL